MHINVFSKKEDFEKYCFGEGSAIMTRLVGYFCCHGFAVTLAIALLTSIEGAWLHGFVQACIKTI